MTKQYKKGDTVKTIHGETLVVEEVRYTEPATKKGIVIEEGKPYIIAMSGGHLTQFPMEKIKA